MAIAATTFGGLLEHATRPKQTVILVQVRTASVSRASGLAAALHAVSTSALPHGRHTSHYDAIPTFSVKSRRHHAASQPSTKSCVRRLRRRAVSAFSIGVTDAERRSADRSWRRPPRRAAACTTPSARAQRTGPAPSCPTSRPSWPTCSRSWRSLWRDVASRLMSHRRGLPGTAEPAAGRARAVRLFQVRHCLVNVDRGSYGKFAA